MKEEQANRLGEIIEVAMRQYLYGHANNWNMIVMHLDDVKGLVEKVLNKIDVFEKDTGSVVDTPRTLSAARDKRWEPLFDDLQDGQSIMFEAQTFRELDSIRQGAMHSIRRLGLDYRLKSKINKPDDNGIYKLYLWKYTVKDEFAKRR